MALGFGARGRVEVCSSEFARAVGAAADIDACGAREYDALRGTHYSKTLYCQVRNPSKWDRKLPQASIAPAVNPEPCIPRSAPTMEDWVQALESRTQAEERLRTALAHHAKLLAHVRSQGWLPSRARGAAARGW